MEMAGVEAGSTTGDGPASQQGGSGKGGSGKDEGNLQVIKE